MLEEVLKKIAANEIQEVSLVGQQIGDTGAMALAKALANNKSVHALHLRNNNIDIEGITSLAKMLETNTNIRHVGLSYNPFGDEGVYKLTSAIKINKTVVSLDLSSCGITTSGIFKIVDLLSTRHSIHTLVLGGNKGFYFMESSLNNLFGDRIKKIKEAAEIDTTEIAKRITVITNPVVETNSSQQTILQAVEQGDLDKVPDAHYYAGNRLMELKRLGEATHEYEQAIKYNPYSYASYYKQGLCLAELGYTDKAELFYQKAIKLSDNVPIVSVVEELKQNELSHFSSFETLRTGTFKQNGIEKMYLLIRDENGIDLRIYNPTDDSWSTATRGPIWSNIAGFGECCYYQTLRTAVLTIDGKDRIYLAFREPSGFALHYYDPDKNQWVQAQKYNSNFTDALAWNSEAYSLPTQLVATNQQQLLLVTRGQNGLYFGTYDPAKNEWKFQGPTGTFGDTQGWNTRSCYTSMSLNSLTTAPEKAVFLGRKSNGSPILQFIGMGVPVHLTPTQDSLINPHFDKLSHYRSTQTHILAIGKDDYLFMLDSTDEGVRIYKTGALLEAVNDIKNNWKKSEAYLKIFPTKSDLNPAFNTNNGFGGDDFANASFIRMTAIKIGNEQKLLVMGQGKNGFLFYTVDPVNLKWQELPISYLFEGKFDSRLNLSLRVTVLNLSDGTQELVLTALDKENVKVHRYSLLNFFPQHYNKYDITRLDAKREATNKLKLLSKPKNSSNQTEAEKLIVALQNKLEQLDQSEKRVNAAEFCSLLVAQNEQNQFTSTNPLSRLNCKNYKATNANISGNNSGNSAFLISALLFSGSAILLLLLIAYLYKRYNKTSAQQKPEKLHDPSEREVIKKLMRAWLNKLEEMLNHFADNYLDPIEPKKSKKVFCELIVSFKQQLDEESLTSELFTKLEALENDIIKAIDSCKEPIETIDEGLEKLYEESKAKYVQGQIELYLENRKLYADKNNLAQDSQKLLEQKKLLENEEPIVRNDEPQLLREELRQREEALAQRKQELDEREIKLKELEKELEHQRINLSQQQEKLDKVISYNLQRLESESKAALKKALEAQNKLAIANQLLEEAKLRVQKEEREKKLIAARTEFFCDCLTHIKSKNAVSLTQMLTGCLPEQANTLDSQGNNLLHHAAQIGDSEIIDILLKAKVRSNIKNNEQQFPYEVAEQAGHEKITTQLRKQLIYDNVAYTLRPLQLLDKFAERKLEQKDLRRVQETFKRIIEDRKNFESCLDRACVCNPTKAAELKELYKEYGDIYDIFFESNSIPDIFRLGVEKFKEKENLTLALLRDLTSRQNLLQSARNGNQLTMQDVLNLNEAIKATSVLAGFYNEICKRLSDSQDIYPFLKQEEILLFARKEMSELSKDNSAQVVQVVNNAEKVPEQLIHDEQSAVLSSFDKMDGDITSLQPQELIKVQEALLNTLEKHEKVNEEFIEETEVLATNSALQTQAQPKLLLEQIHEGKKLKSVHPNVSIINGRFVPLLKPLNHLEQIRAGGIKLKKSSQNVQVKLSKSLEEKLSHQAKNGNIMAALTLKIIKRRKDIEPIDKDVEEDNEFENEITYVTESVHPTVSKLNDDPQAVGANSLVETNNLAVQAFLGDGNDQSSHLNFRTWYHPDVCHYLLQLVPNLAKCIRVIFSDAGYDNNTQTFKDQLQQLVMLGNALRRPAIFISKEPGADNHFICGLVKENKLLLINPLGITTKSDCYQTIFELKKEGTIGEVWFSSNPLQKHLYEEEGLVSCGAVTLELATHILSQFTSTTLEQFWNQLKTNEPTTHEQSGLIYHGINIKVLLPETLQALEKADDKTTYINQACSIRGRHLQQLRVLPVQRAKAEKMATDDYLKKCKESALAQVLFNRLVTKEKNITDIVELSEYLLLKQELNTQVTSLVSNMNSHPGIPDNSQKPLVAQFSEHSHVTTPKLKTHQSQQLFGEKDPGMIPAIAIEIFRHCDQQSLKSVSMVCTSWQRFFKSSQVVATTSTEDTEIPASKRQKTGDSSVGSVSGVLSEKRFFSSKESSGTQISSSSSEDVVMNDINVVQTKTKPN